MKEPILTISTGRLRGKIGTSINGKQFYSFQGIPYAKPPLGDLRFKAPLPAESWTDVRDATHEGSDCIHRIPIVRTIQGGEDCLTLNVYTPELAEKRDDQTGKAVMVWIHGGGFISGSGSSQVYGPEFLMNKDIVLVSINYRTGILGFLSLEDPDLDVQGNAGLKDMVMALKWIKDNIEFFSGNPNNVTIFGESAGAAASHYLILSPLAKGFFHKAILQSGCALNVWAAGRRCALELAQILELETTNEKQILNVLQSLPIDKLFKAAEKLPDPFLASITRPHGPVIERRSSGAFLCDHPLEFLKTGKFSHVPIMIGYTNREGILSEFFQKPKPFKPLTDFELAVPNFLKLQQGSDYSKVIAKKIKEFYYGKEEPSSSNKDNFYLLETDNFFLREILLTAKLHSKYAPVFLYRMSVETNLNMMKNISGITEPGVCHADDLGYLFKNTFTPEVAPGSDEELAINRFITLWTNFAKNGDPNPKKINSIINVKWKPVDRNEINFLEIGKNLTLGVNPEPERMAFWKNVLKPLFVSKL